MSDSKVLPISFTQYKGFLEENTLSKNKKLSNQIKEVGKKIATAVDLFMRANNMVSEANSYQWDFNLIEDKKVNAWCMPGGKVVFYTGIMPVCLNENGVAAVMGHEVAHALANHGQQRMSAAIIQQAGAAGIAAVTNDKSSKEQNLWMKAYGAGTSVGGMLPFSRSHESEADMIGLTLMAIAGYNPDTAIAFWERMAAQSAGQSPLVFMSTHPSNATRIAKIKELIPLAKAEAAKFGVTFK